MSGFRNDSARRELSRLGGGPAARLAGLLSPVLSVVLALVSATSSADTPVVAAAEQAKTRSIAWTPFTADAFTAAERGKAPFVLSFGAQWCEPCDKMKARTYTNEAVVEAAAGLRFLSVDMTHRGGYVGLVLKSFQVFGAPTTIFFGPDGKEWQRRIGFIAPDEYARMLRESWKSEKSS
ncbi:MAG: thioredoxin family protein [Deltaproteobacteria bacterium]|nr:thioredoxin family protein [Deltaproteobacteria bacterium]